MEVRKLTESCCLKKHIYIYIILILYCIFQTFEKHDGACQREQYFRSGSALRELHDLRLLNGGGGGGGGSFVFTVKYRFLEGPTQPMCIIIKQTFLIRSSDTPPLFITPYETGTICKITI